MDPTLMNLLFQAGAIGIFILYALVRDKRESEERTARERAAKEERDGRDAEWRTFLAEQSEFFRKDAVTRDESWRTLIEEQRRQRLEAMDQGTGYVKDLTMAVASVAEGLANHDLAAQERHDQLAKAVDNIQRTVRENRKLIEKAPTFARAKAH
jgi:hypothetical protein